MPEAKQVSKGAMIFATAYIIVMPLIANALQWRLTVDEIIKIAISIVILWSPIYLSVWLDKFTQRRNHD